MNKIRILAIGLLSTLSTLLLIVSQGAYAYADQLDFSQEIPDVDLSLVVSIDEPVILMLVNDDLDDLSNSMLSTRHDVEVTDYGRDSYQLIAAMPVSYRAYDLYRAYKVPFPRSH